MYSDTFGQRSAPETMFENECVDGKWSKMSKHTSPTECPIFGTTFVLTIVFTQSAIFTFRNGKPLSYYILKQRFVASFDEMILRIPKESVGTNRVTVCKAWWGRMTQAGKPFHPSLHLHEKNYTTPVIVDTQVEKNCLLVGGFDVFTDVFKWMQSILESLDIQTDVSVECIAVTRVSQTCMLTFNGSHQNENACQMFDALCQMNVDVSYKKKRILKLFR